MARRNVSYGTRELPIYMQFVPGIASNVVSMKYATTGDVAAALAAGHQAADYLLQTEHQAETKMNRDRAGQLACMRHTAVHTACKSAALLGLRTTGRRLVPRRVLTALAVDAATHYLADRREPLLGLMKLLDAAGVTGKARFWHIGETRPGHDDNECLGTGKHYLDQAWHAVWVYIAALIAAGKAE